MLSTFSKKLFFGSAQRSLVTPLKSGAVIKRQGSGFSTRYFNMIVATSYFDGKIEEL